MRQDITQTIENITRFCRCQLMSVAVSPAKRTVLLTLVAAVLAAGSGGSPIEILQDPGKDKPTWPAPPESA